MSRADGMGRRFLPPLNSGSVSVGTEPRRERPRSKCAKPYPRAATGSFTSRFRMSSASKM